MLKALKISSLYGRAGGQVCDVGFIVASVSSVGVQLCVPHQRHGVYAFLGTSTGTIRMAR